MVKEAGGRVNDFLAGDGLTKGNAIFAAAPGIAEEFAAVVGVPLPVENHKMREIAE
jgi:myo-inositol-1(or 4)-monophosphatase